MLAEEDNKFRSRRADSLVRFSEANKLYDFTRRVNNMYVLTNRLDAVAKQENQKKDKRH